jgi:hypothetical protein
MAAWTAAARWRSGSARAPTAHLERAHPWWTSVRLQQRGGTTGSPSGSAALLGLAQVAAQRLVRLVRVRRSSSCTQASALKSPGCLIAVCIHGGKLNGFSRLHDVAVSVSRS